MNRKLTFAIAISLLAHPAQAGVGKLSSAEVNAGELNGQYNWRRTGDDRKSMNNAQDHILELEYGLDDDWMVGIALDVVRRPAGRTEYVATGFEAKRQLTAQSDGWWFNSAAKLEYTFAAQSRDTNSGEMGWLFSRQDGKIKTTANLKFTREFGDGKTSGTQFDTALQSIYYQHRYLSPGIEWHADYGPIDDFLGRDRQEHYLGGIIVGKLLALEQSDLSYELGYFRGMTDASADDAQRARLQYKIRF